MQSHWSIRKGEPELIIFALGWASDPKAIAHIRPEGYDILSLFDYRTIEPLSPEVVAPYRKAHLFAWSFGVWASELIFREVQVNQAVALNGTPRPIDLQYGIPPRAFLVTLRGLPTAGIEPFYRRCYSALYAHCSPVAPRSLEKLHTELKRLHELCEEKNCDHPREDLILQKGESLQWTGAIIGEGDLIFPPENQAAYWHTFSPSLPIVHFKEMPHYPFADQEVILSQLDLSVKL